MAKHQLSLTLIQHHVNNSVIEQRFDDGYINATALCNAAGKRWYNYLRDETSGHFIRALESKTGLATELLIQEQSDSYGAPSTWVHPKVAIHLAQWLSAEFAVQVSEWVYDWITEGKSPSTPASNLPYHIERHMLNSNSVPAGHFSILQEMTFMLIGPLENHGYTLPENLVPDISMGQFLCKHLREKIGIETSSLPIYLHRYPDGRVVEAKLYPNEYLAEFRKIIQEEWLPSKSAAYFMNRDPKALPYLDKVILALPGPLTAANIKKLRHRKD